VTNLKKESVLKALQTQLEADLIPLKEAALATYGDATHEENKPENKYDTRALEASYLAGAQAERVKDIEEMITICKFQQIRNFTTQDKISITALVQVESNDKTSWLFMLPKGGGFLVQYQGKSIQVITPASPLGQALIGKSSGDSVTIRMKETNKTYDIVSVC
jgi:transcription elongation GreA/GreB family factor